MRRKHMGKMAIVKASFTRSRSEAKAFIRYIQHRKGLDGQKITRELYGLDGALARLEGYEMIDAAERGSVFFRIIINPDPKTENTHKDLSLKAITAQTMHTLAELVGREVPYIAATHADHAPLPHAHILACVKGRLNTKDLQALRETATEAALAQRQERDKQQEQQREGGELALQR
jgi:hypothetical protein